MKLFTDVIFECLQSARVFVLGKPIQPCLLFVDKARNLLQSGAPESCFTRLGSGFTHTRLERPAGYKHSSFLQTFVNYGRKRF
jgi:hypothetical protein